jgi:trehalose/maltose hydrolase-like predicted phosphorylase
MVSNKTVAFASAYSFEYPVGYDRKADNMGFNVYKYNQLKACQHFSLPMQVLNTTTKLQIITAHMTDVDFENPLEEVKRIVMANIASLATIRNNHVNSWGSRWNSSMHITPKIGIGLDLDNDVKAINQLIKVAYYNLYTSTRDNINAEINPMNLYVIDREGMILYEGDLWFIPLLTIIKPDTARSLLEQRYKTIQMAQQISGGFGYKGAKYPYSNDTLGYKHMVYYNTSAAISIFNNALISLNVWNYYRVTKDYDWLQHKGFSIMKNIADFFISIIKFDSITNSYNLENISSLSQDAPQLNNSFTNNMVKLSLKYTIEACYELGIKPSDKWIQYFNGLPILYLNPDDFNDIIKVNDNSSENDEYFILDVLFVLVPYYSDLFFSIDEQNHNQNSLKRNLDYYIKKINTKYSTHPYNTALLAIVYGMYAQNDNTYIHRFDYFLHKFIKENIIDNDFSGSVNVWLNMKSFGSSTFNSLTTNSILLMIIMQALPQVHVSGGVASSKFYYEEMKASVRKNAIMPCHWNDIQITNIGNPDNPRSYTIKNQILFTSQVACVHPAPL